MQAALNKAILSNVVAAIRETSYVTDVQITPETRFVEDLALDSLELVELAMRLEEVFDLEFPSSFVGRLEIVSDVVLYVSRRFFVDIAPDPGGGLCWDRTAQQTIGRGGL